MQPLTALPPATAAILDALPHTHIPTALGKPAPPRPNAPPNSLPPVVCPEHGAVVCGPCQTDFRDINHLGFYMNLVTPDQPPPPPHVAFAKQAEAVVQMREQGNKRFKAGQFREAATLYSRSVALSMGKPSWEQAKSSLDEVTAALLNRSASAAMLEEWPAALADADACIRLSPKNAKGYFRKAKALEGMGRIHEAVGCMTRGSVVEPDNQVGKHF